MKTALYYTKDEALRNIKEGERLFAIDHEKITNEGLKKVVKQFFVATYENIERSLQKDRNIYEHYGYQENQKVKFFLDLDYKLEEEYSKEFETKDELFNEIVLIVEKFLSEKFTFDSKKIVLDASNKDKFSFHIIYPNFVFDSVKSIKNLMKEFNDEYRGILDKSVYDNRCFRCINQSKINKKNSLKGDCKILDSLLLYTSEQNIMTYEEKETLKQKNIRVKNIKTIDLLNTGNFIKSESVVKLTKEQIEFLVNLFAEKRYEEYDYWIRVLWSLKCENTNDYFIIFNDFSKKSKKYKKDEVTEKWNEYDPTKVKKKYTYNSLLYWAKEDSFEEYKKFCVKNNLFTREDKEIIINDILNIKSPYLLMNKILKDCAVSEYITNFMNSKKRGMLIKSPYNTGKTTLLTQICNKYKRILFISYRITLSNNLQGSFKKLGFELYNENINAIHANKLICQVDSLHRINNINFDLVIIDESESVLNHFASASLKNKLETFEIMADICFNTNKIIALDGDLGNRTKVFMNGFGETLMINNTIIKDPRHFYFQKNEIDFKAKITQDLKDEKNICIVSMSEQKANEYYELFSGRYKTIKYTSKTNDEDKKMLCEVKKIWSSHQLIIYSPSIESGVDFDIEHFDKIYIIMSANSTSQRGLCQMMHRVRQLKDNNIYVLLNTILPNETSMYRHYNFEEIQYFYKTLACDDSFIRTFDGEKIVYEEEQFNIYDIVQMYNKLEFLNKNPSCFLPIFIKMITEKGHTYDFINDERSKKETIPNIVLNKILDANEIGGTKFEELQKKQAQQNLNESEKFEMVKFLYEKTFNIKIDNIEILRKFYNRLDVIKNIKGLLDNANITLKDSELKNKEKMKKTQEIRNLLKELEIDEKELLSKEYTLTRDKLLEKMPHIDKFVKRNKILFNLNKTIEINSSQKLIGTLRTLLDNYGIEIERVQKNIRENDKIEKENTYTFKLEDEIKNKLNTKKKEIEILEIFNI